MLGRKSIITTESVHVINSFNCTLTKGVVTVFSVLKSVVSYENSTILEYASRKRERERERERVRDREELFLGFIFCKIFCHCDEILNLVRTLTKNEMHTHTHLTFAKLFSYNYLA